MKKMTRKRPRNVHELLLWEARDVLEKLGDLEFGRKVERLLDRQIDDTLAVVRCVEHFRSYINCSVSQESAPVVQKLKLRLLVHTDALLVEVRKRSGKRAHRRLPKAFRKRLVEAYWSLLTSIHEGNEPLIECNEHWANMMKAANVLWPDEIRL
jgi:hypothetical protein